MIERKHKYRLIISAVIMVLALIGLSARLVFLHLGPYTERRVQINELRRLERDLNVARGKILDRNGNILALDLVQKEICADPVVVHSNHQAQAVALSLGNILQIDSATIMARLNSPASRFVYLIGYGRYVDDEQASEIIRMKFPGVFLNDVMVRSYPRGASMCHVLGYVNLEREGSAGIEQRWDRYLQGVTGLLISELDGQRRELYDRRTLEIKPRKGADVTLTIDQYVQYIVERALESAVSEHQAAAAWAIVECVRTGEILAMANWPGYDANQFRTTVPDVMRNRCVANLYEPGSTFKIAVVAAALNEQVVTSSQVFDCERGTWFYRGRPLRDYHPYDKLSVADVIKKSSNIGAAKIALLLGDAPFFRYLKAFGIGEMTGIELPGEEAGILHPVSKWQPISATRIAIGHEVAVTALQMLGVICAIANDGMLMKPYIVQRVTGSDGHVLFEQKPVVVSRPIRPETAAEMKRLLTRVTEEDGTGRRARVEGYTVGGKTGTAQKPIPGGYSDVLNMASFTGFIPAEDPQLAIIVVLDEPKNVRTGGAVAAPVFKEIAEQSVRYLDIPPAGNDNFASHASGVGSRGM
ncbi:MAG: penicillin-binding protein 2 [Verrucomicrobia bacterium]|nr:penicillin-binding protein 2 [Verrucomicrobiota bacterium]MBU4291227.1 penicillin-binding protein 2 [Verrucomicrobiota bacterium]MBU4428809.1 penicillin-binding protein 2 [Verrucomicrobiota bacterium]MCG2680954.1 penicillin-binding protein 2 [Kiritimatiellia bacterium]